MVTGTINSAIQTSLRVRFVSGVNHYDVFNHDDIMSDPIEYFIQRDLLSYTSSLPDVISISSAGVMTVR